MCQIVSQILYRGSVLVGNNVYTYGEKDLYEEAHYQKYILVNFINNMGYLREATSITEVDKKRLKRLIDISFFLRTCNLEERKTIFGKLQLYFL